MAANNEVNMEHRMTEAEGKITNLQKRVDGIAKRQDQLQELTITVKGLVIKEENVENTVKEIKDDVKTLTSKSAKRWDGVVEKAISAVVGGLIAYAFFKLGLA